MCLDPKLGVFAGKVKPGTLTFDGYVMSVQREGNIITITFEDKVQQYSEFDVLMVGVGSAIGAVEHEPDCGAR